MFKYFWIFVLVIIAAAILIYTIYAIKETLEEYELYDWRDFWLVFIDDHYFLCVFYAFLVFLAALISWIMWIL